MKMNKFKMSKNDKGQGIIEFVLILPLLLLIIFGIIEFSRAAYYKTLMNNATKEAIRMVSVGSDSSNIADNIKSNVIPLMGDTTASITTSNDDEGNSCTKITLTPSAGNAMTIYITPTYNNSLQNGDTVRICIDYTLQYITPLSELFGSISNMKSIYYTRIESPPQ